MSNIPFNPTIRKGIAGGMALSQKQLVGRILVFIPIAIAQRIEKRLPLKKKRAKTSLFQAPGFIRGVLILNWSVCVRPTALPCILRQALPQRRMVSEARQSDVTSFSCIADFWCRWAIGLWCNWMD